ncbi:MAG TPA: hypothetical protein VKB93_29735 [Thermoanaerobaculia bacterium]|nr:hypothetical protein [Thermoanaerobaculia bacterium]
MWRWVTRGLVLALLAALLAPALTAQEFIGVVEKPDPNVVQSGMVLVQGWALDVAQISKIELYVDDQYQHDLVLRLPRIDIALAFPTFPGIQAAQPGFLTGFSSTRFTNGNHTVELRVYSNNGQIHFIGRRTITINNSINQAPFGYIDIPNEAGVYNATGSFPVNGWAADLDGINRIEVLIDGGIIQGAMFGDPRPDVGASYPDFPAALLSGWVANVDTTKVENGVHLLEVRAVDRLGMSNMLGRRQIQVINNDFFLAPFGYLDEPLRDAVLWGSCTNQPVRASPIVRTEAHLTPVRGWALDLGTRGRTGRVAYAELLIDGVSWYSTNDCGIILGRFANCYGLPRYDVARYYPTYPDAPRAGFFFTMDVGALMSNGVRPGNHTMHIRVGDLEGTFADLPNGDGIPVWFQCAPDNFGFPSTGFIEFPQRYDYVGGDVVFRGWAINEQGVKEVQLIVDGTYVGNAIYGLPRPDVQEQYPFVVDSRLSGWSFTFDTRKLVNSQHRLTVRVVSKFGTSNEIGSQDFYVANNNPQP